MDVSSKAKCRILACPSSEKKNMESLMSGVCLMRTEIKCLITKILGKISRIGINNTLFLQKKSKENLKRLQVKLLMLII